MAAGGIWPRVGGRSSLRWRSSLSSRPGGRARHRLVRPAELLLCPNSTSEDLCCSVTRLVLVQAPVQVMVLVLVLGWRVLVLVNVS